jgi:hypothetical protein
MLCILIRYGEWSSAQSPEPHIFISSHLFTIMRIIFSEKDKREIKERAQFMHFTISDEDFKKYSDHMDLYKNYTLLAEDIKKKR